MVTKVINFFAFAVSTLASTFLLLYILNYIIRLIYSSPYNQTSLAMEPLFIFLSIWLPANIVVIPALLYSLESRLNNKGKNIIWLKTKSQRIELKSIYTAFIVWTIPLVLFIASISLSALGSR